MGHILSMKDDKKEVTVLCDEYSRIPHLRIFRMRKSNFENFFRCFEFLVKM